MVKDLLKQLQGQDSGQWANNRVSGLDRTLGEISRILEKQVALIQMTVQVEKNLNDKTKQFRLLSPSEERRL